MTEAASSIGFAKLREQLMQQNTDQSENRYETGKRLLLNHNSSIMVAKAQDE